MSDECTPEQIERAIFEAMEEGMRMMGVVTTAHYDAGHGLIAYAVRQAEARGAEAIRRAALRRLNGRRSEFDACCGVAVERTLDRLDGDIHDIPGGTTPC